MARPTEFNRDQAVRAAMKLFWAQGYTATSLSQLLDVMGIGRSSFYAAFGDKRSLFIECLNLFYRRTRDIVQQAWNTHHSPAAFEEFFDRTLFQVSESRAACGCMMVNSVLELADVDEGLNRLAAAHLAQIEALFIRCFSSAQESGSYPDELPAEDLGASLMVINQGLRVASRKGTPRAQLRKTVDSSLAVMGLTAA